ncbi:hypothetical protein ANN_04299 [Periplaneta americana]|uniref:Uncharacterized protein n=1 Tax=Periplaneta americana TaxID=6978 RepID=A0ABQ8TAL3_PERAM|nr:hypothetical protein ANN_04299 [Periplaneta americana]
MRSYESSSTDHLRRSTGLNINNQQDQNINLGTDDIEVYNYDDDDDDDDDYYTLRKFLFPLTIEVHGFEKDIATIRHSQIQIEQSLTPVSKRVGVVGRKREKSTASHNVLVSRIFAAAALDEELDPTFFLEMTNIIEQKIEYFVGDKTVKANTSNVVLYDFQETDEAFLSCIPELRRHESKRIATFEMWIWRRTELVKWTDRIRNEAVLERGSEERMMLKMITKRRRNWLGHWLRINCLLKDALERMVKGRRVRGRRRYQMIDDIKIYGSYEETKRKGKNRKYWRKLGLQ